MQIKGVKKLCPSPLAYPSSPPRPKSPILPNQNILLLHKVLQQRIAYLCVSQSLLCKHEFLSALRFFPTAGDKSFWKVESGPRGDHTQSLSCARITFSCWGQADTHTLTHTHKMAALTKFPLPNFSKTY